MGGAAGLTGVAGLRGLLSESQLNLGLETGQSVEAEEGDARFSVEGFRCTAASPSPSTGDSLCILLSSLPPAFASASTLPLYKERSPRLPAWESSMTLLQGSGEVSLMHRQTQKVNQSIV